MLIYILNHDHASALSINGETESNLLFKLKITIQQTI